MPLCFFPLSPAEQKRRKKIRSSWCTSSVRFLILFRRVYAVSCRIEPIVLVRGEKKAESGKFQKARSDASNTPFLGRGGKKKGGAQQRRPSRQSAPIDRTPVASLVRVSKTAPAKQNVGSEAGPFSASSP